MRNLLFAVLCFLTANAFAEKVEGAGSMTCAKYLELSPEEAAKAQSWVQGYLSAVNFLSVRTNNILGNEDGAWEKFSHQLTEQCKALLPHEGGREHLLVEAVLAMVAMELLSDHPHDSQMMRLVGRLKPDERFDLQDSLFLQDLLSTVKANNGKGPGPKYKEMEDFAFQVTDRDGQLGLRSGVIKRILTEKLEKANKQ